MGRPDNTNRRIRHSLAAGHRCCEDRLRPKGGGVDPVAMRTPCAGGRRECATQTQVAINSGSQAFGDRAELETHSSCGFGCSRAGRRCTTTHRGVLPLLNRGIERHRRTQDVRSSSRPILSTCSATSRLSASRRPRKAGRTALTSPPRVPRRLSRRPQAGTATDCGRLLFRISRLGTTVDKCRVRHNDP